MVLVLSRQAEEDIVIDHPEGRIIVRVLSFPQRGRVSLGIIAPAGVGVVRGELVRREA